MANTGAQNVTFYDAISPPTIIIRNIAWRHSMVHNSVLRRTFDTVLLQAISEGVPQPADQVFILLSHWVISCMDSTAIQETYLLRLRLDVALYSIAIQRSGMNHVMWNLLGSCSMGRQIAARVNLNMEFDPAADWQCFTIWDWVRVGSTDRVTVFLGVGIPGALTTLYLSQLHETVFRVLISGAHLWPRYFPVVDSDAVERFGNQGLSFHESIVYATIQLTPSQH